MRKIVLIGLLLSSLWSANDTSCDSSRTSNAYKNMMKILIENNSGKDVVITDFKFNTLPYSIQKSTCKSKMYIEFQYTPRNGGRLDVRTHKAYYEVLLTYKKEKNNNAIIKVVGHKVVSDLSIMENVFNKY